MRGDAAFCETQLTSWRRLARDGRPVLALANADAEFAPSVMRAERSRAVEASLGRLEVCSGQGGGAVRCSDAHGLACADCFAADASA